MSLNVGLLGRISSRYRNQSRYVSRCLRLERLESRNLLASDWQNPFVTRDVDSNGIVVPFDALIAVNELNARLFSDEAGNLANRAEHPDAPCYDINGDGIFVPLDVLLIINALNTDQTGPIINVRLANDTAPGGVTNQDRISSDGTIAGNVFDELTGVAQLTIQIDDDLAIDVLLNRDGRFEFPVQLPDGNHSARFLARDGMGHETTFDNFDFTIDTLPVDPPTNVTMEPASDTGRSSSDGITNISTPTFRGDAPAGTYITLYANDRAVGTVAANGDWEISSHVLPDGTYEFAVTAQDVAGNSSAIVAANTLTIDCTPPGTPDFWYAYWLISKYFQGWAEPNSIFSLYVDGNLHLTRVASTNGLFYNVAFDLLPSLPNGRYDLTATATDVAGNVSPVFGPLVYNHYIPVLPPPDRIILNPESDTGSSNSDGITSDTTPTFTVYAGEAQLIKYYVDGQYIGWKFPTLGEVQFTAPELTDGPHQISARNYSDIGSGDQYSDPVWVDIVIDTTME